MIYRNKIKMLGLFFLTLLVAGCGSDDEAPPAPPVVVSKPVLAQVTDYLIETGNTVSYNSVDLVARVSGYLDSVNFRDGSIVKKNQLLFVIQPAPYLAQVEEAEASLTADKAQYAYDLAEYQRQLVMYKQNATSQADVQQWLANRDSAKAAVGGAVANLEVAKINYSYTHVLAPFNGRISRHLVDVGNLVGNGSATKLATIEQIAPMYVYFNINELDLLKLRKAARAAGIKPSEINQIPVSIGLQNEEGFPHKGHLDYVDTGLDASTGTIQMRSIFENKHYDLLPGLFVRVRIAINKPQPRLMVPDTSVMYDQIGAYLFTVNKNNEVIQTRITTGSREKGMIVVLTGIKSDDSIIVSGIQNATPGGKVAPTEKPLK